MKYERNEVDFKKEVELGILKLQSALHLIPENDSPQLEEARFFINKAIGLVEHEFEKFITKGLKK